MAPSTVLPPLVRDLPITDRDGAILDDALMPVTPDQDAMRAQADGPVIEDRHRQRVYNQATAITV